MATYYDASFNPGPKTANDGVHGTQMTLRNPTAVAFCLIDQMQYLMDFNASIALCKLRLPMSSLLFALIFGPAHGPSKLLDGMIALGHRLNRSQQFDFQVDSVGFFVSK